MVSPWSSTWISSQTPMTTCMLCSTSTTVSVERVAQPADLRLQPLGLAVVHAGGGLVEEEQLRLEHHRARDLEAALVAVRERGGRLVGDVLRGRRRRAARSRARASLLVVVVRRRAEDRGGEVRALLELARDEQVLEHRELREEADVLERARDARPRRSARARAGARSCRRSGCVPSSCL